MLRRALCVLLFAVALTAVMPSASAESLSGCAGVITDAVASLRPGDAGYDPYANACNPLKNLEECLCKATCTVDDVLEAVGKKVDNLVATAGRYAP